MTLAGQGSAQGVNLLSFPRYTRGRAKLRSVVPGARRVELPPAINAESGAAKSCGDLDRGVAEGELDLLERSASLVGELGEGPPQIVQIVRCDLAESDPESIGGDRLEDRLFL